MTSTVWAAVALKSPATAKSRLSKVLADAERRQLYFLMARRVISSLTATARIARVLVVAAGCEIADFAVRAGAQVIRQDEENGTAAAFICAIDTVKAVRPPSRPDRLLMIAGDLPLISPAAVSALLDAGNAHGVCIVPDRWRWGTNALMCSPPDLLRPCFGNESFARHCSAARELGSTVHVHESHALSLDIDVADDLALWGAHMLGIGYLEGSPGPVLRRLANEDLAERQGDTCNVRYA